MPVQNPTRKKVAARSDDDAKQAPDMKQEPENDESEFGADSAEVGATPAEVEARPEKKKPRWSTTQLSTGCKVTVGTRLNDGVLFFFIKHATQGQILQVRVDRFASLKDAEEFTIEIAVGFCRGDEKFIDKKACRRFRDENQPELQKGEKPSSDSD